MNIRHYLFLLLLWSILINTPEKSLAQNSFFQVDTSEISPISFEKKSLDNYRANDEFNYSEVIGNENETIKKIKKWIRNFILRFFKWLFGESNALKYFVFFFKYIPYVTLALVLFLLLKFFLKIDTYSLKNSKVNNSPIVYKNEEELIRSKDLDKLIKSAIKTQNYRLAIRYYYLKSLKLLEQKEMIKWEDQKTNYEYLNELKNSKFNSNFRKFTFWYDYVWYGDFSINDSDFMNISNSFNEFYKEIEV